MLEQAPSAEDAASERLVLAARRPMTHRAAGDSPSSSASSTGDESSLVIRGARCAIAEGVRHEPPVIGERASTYEVVRAARVPLLERPRREARRATRASAGSSRSISIVNDPA